jgi:pSer/pThr/pTyr-binding forkhead associated (FHA) protein
MPAARPPGGPPPDQLTVVHAEPAVRPDAPPPAESTVIDARTADVSNLATRFVKLLSPRMSAAAGTLGSKTIGRAAESDIVVYDVLASRHHATLVQTPLGTEIRDNSINGTFVNGTRVGSAILTDGDVVTIGNVDLVFRDGTLVEGGAAAARTGGLEVRNVKYVVDNGKQLLDDISLTARPGTLTAVIGGSGAGKSTLARLIAGYTSPTSG